MTAKGHMIVGASITLTIVVEFSQFFYSYSNVMLFFCLSMIGSLLPDLDEPGSYIGRKLPFVSILLSMFIEHRGITHFFILPVLVVAAGILVQSNLSYALIGLSLGILSHDIGDMLTKGGIRGFFWPFFPQSQIGLLPKGLRFYTGSIQEYLLIFALLVYLYILGSYLTFNAEFGI